MIILKIPNLHISYKCIDTLLYGHCCNSYYVEITLFDYSDKVLKSNLLYLLILKSQKCVIKEQKLEYIVQDILNNLQEFSKNYNIEKLILQELTSEVFCYQIMTKYKTFRLCCNTSM